MKLNKDSILQKTKGGLDVFQYYINRKITIGKNFLNPLYADTNPSCNVYFDRRANCYKFKDFGNDEYSGDCFEFVARMRGLDCKRDFVEILKMINQDMSLGLDEDYKTPNHRIVEPTATSTPLSGNQNDKKYRIVQQEFTHDEFQFWLKSGITESILRQYDVVSLREFQSVNKEGKEYSIRSTSDEPMFGYKSSNFVKIYRPFSPKFRFLYGGVSDENYCFGLEQLPSKGDTLFITGGEKDVLTLRAQGYNAICFNSETATIPENTIATLSYRFKHLIILFDSDKPGLDASLSQVGRLSKYDVKRIVLPLSGTKGEKDITDYFSIGFSKEQFSELILDFLDSLYSQTMAVLKSCEIDFSNPPENGKVLISINKVPIGTSGNLLCVTGGEGTGKSNFIGGLIAGTIRNEWSEVDTLGTRIEPNEDAKAVLLYDTEQSDAQLFKNIESTLRRSKQRTKPGYFKAYSLTSLSRKDRLNAIIQSIDKFHYEYGGIQMVIIDGVADLIRCANDEAESIAIVDELYRLAGIYQTCIVCVLHFVPNGLKLRGHLGSELQRKSAAILSIEKESDQILSVVKALKVRDGSPLDVPMIKIGWDKVADMFVYRGEKTTEEREERKVKELKSAARRIFEHKNLYTYTELCEALQDVLEVRERTAKSYIKYMFEQQIIMKDPSNSNVYIKGLF